MNLLPPKVIAKRKCKKLLVILATVQVAIFLLLAGLIHIAQNLEQMAAIQSEKIRERLSYISDEPFEIHSELMEAWLREFAMKAFLEDSFLLPFDREWLMKILQTAPDGVNFRRINYSNGHLLLASEAADILLIDLHRDRLLEIFDSVHFGRINQQDSGLYVYEFTIQTSTFS